MKNLSFWQWIGITFAILAVGTVLLYVIYWKSLSKIATSLTASDPVSNPTPTDNPWAKMSYYPTI